VIKQAATDVVIMRPDDIFNLALRNNVIFTTETVTQGRQKIVICPNQFSVSCYSFLTKQTNKEGRLKYCNRVQFPEVQ